MYVSEYAVENVQEDLFVMLQSLAQAFRVDVGPKGRPVTAVRGALDRKNEKMIMSSKVIDKAGRKLSIQAMSWSRHALSFLWSE